MVDEALTVLVGLVALLVGILPVVAVVGLVLWLGAWAAYLPLAIPVVALSYVLGQIIRETPRWLE